MTATLKRTLPLFVVLVLLGAPHADAQIVPIDLGTLGGTDSVADYVSDSGEVEGMSATAGGDTHRFVWTAAGGMVDLTVRWNALTGDQCFITAASKNDEMLIGFRAFPPAGGGNPTEHACAWTAAGGVIDLGTLGGANSYAYGVNDHGQIVGWSQVTSRLHPFLWTASEGMVDLDPDPSTLWVIGAHIAITNSGYIVGGGDNHVSVDQQGQPIEKSFVWTATSGKIDLPTLGGRRNRANPRNAYRSAPNAITEMGHVVGKAEYYDATIGEPAHRAYLWTPSAGITDLGTLGGSTSEARAVNSSGVVVGVSNTVGGLDWLGNPICTLLPRSNCDQVSIQHAFAWTASDGMIDLGTLGGLRSEARAVNDHGDVIGWSLRLGSNWERAFVWTPAEGMMDLVPLPGCLRSSASHINNRRQIVGYSDGNCDRRATMWELPAPTDWIFCAPEGGVCAFTGTTEVRYGANGMYVYQTFTDGTACTNAVFGDPLYGTRKSCAISIALDPTEWTVCAAEGGVCAFTGAREVRYGANGVYVYRTLTDGTACTNGVFGDPIYGTVKACAIRIPPDPSEWSVCAAEGGVCAFTGAREVRYGANGVWTYQTLLDGTACINQVFGDPLYGMVKFCSLRTASGSSLTSR